MKDEDIDRRHAAATARNEEHGRSTRLVNDPGAD
jgi:hypothetical protein